MKKAIEKRVSVRSYKKKSLTDKDKLSVQKILKNIEKQKGPFGHSVRFFFVDNGSTRQTKKGTYGFIKNPPSFIGGVVKNTQEGMVDFGFLMEKAILELTELNLGTVWLGGTYHRKDFDVELRSDEIIAAVTPVGYPTKKSIREHIVRGLSRGNKRKPYNDLFFQGMNLNKISNQNKYYQYMELVQFAPSASNKQPWRIIITDDILHIFLARTKNYANVLNFDIQSIDIGIAISHLYLSLLEDGYTPSFANKNSIHVTNWEYIISLSTI